MDLVFVDKLASQNNRVKYLLVAVGIFSRYFRVQMMKTKYAKDTLQAFRIMISRKNTPEKLWINKGTENGGNFKKFGKEKDIEVYSTMSETKAAFAERAIQFLKKIIYRYIKDHVELFVPKLQQFVSTLNCRKNRSIGKAYRVVKNSDFLSILYNKTFKKYTKSKFKIGDRDRISKNDILFRKGYEPQFTDKILEISAISTKKHLLHTSSKNSKKKKFWENFMKKS